MSDGAYKEKVAQVTLTERINREPRHLPDNVVPMDRKQRRSVPRWIEWTRENQKQSVKDLTGYIGGGEAA